MPIGSLVNAIASGKGQPEPEVGQGATICMWTDRQPVTVVAILRFKSGPKAGQIRGVEVTDDSWTVVKGSEHDGSAQYTYTSNPDGPRKAFLIDQYGRYVRKGGGDRLSLGRRERYSDPSF